MPKLLTTLIPLLVVVAVAACDSDGGPANSRTPPTASPEVTLTPESPTGESASPTPTFSRVTPPRDIGEFLDHHADDEIIQQPCTFDAGASQVDCGENGLYEPAPAPADENTECEVLLVHDEPIAVSCEIRSPPTVIYYEIRP